MAATLQFDLVSPERKLASVSATEVQIPGTDGDLTAMAGHAATITTLRPGVLKAIGADGTKAFVVTGGFAEITAAGVSVLAERAVPVEEANATVFETLLADVKATAAGMDKDAGEKLVGDLMAAKAAIGA
jgi:F-type H+-transporting ATPase subunit epsilon